LVYDLLDIHCQLEPTVLADFSNLKAYQARIEALPAIAAYMKSNEFIAKPIAAGKALNGQAAAWGGQ
jgi:glutathione S-transferase